MPLAEADFPGERGDAALARRFVHDALTDLDVPDVDDIAVLLTSELVTNAVLHARSTVTVRVVASDDGGRAVRIEVEDRSRAVPVRKQYSEQSATGRGVMLVESLANGWGVEELPDGKRVWFVLDPSVSSHGAPDAFDAAAGAGAAAGFDDVDLGALAASLGEPETSDGRGRETMLVGAVLVG